MTFYKTTITYTVLSDGDLIPLDMAQVVEECDSGGFVCADEQRITEEVTPETMAALLNEAGSDPGFFGIQGDCILTGAEGENPDDCTTHEHEEP